jgi:hypothetical protein
MDKNRKPKGEGVLLTLSLSLFSAAQLNAVGDNILMNGEIHRIKKITLLYTEMITLNGER